MTEETPQEASSGEQAPPASEAPQEKPSPEFVSKADLSAFGAEIVKEVVNQVVPRLKQSQKDTIKDRVASEVGEALSSFDAVAALLKPHLPEDLDLQGIKRQAFIDSLMQQPSPAPEKEEPSSPQPEPPKPASLPPGREAEIAAILEEHGLTGQEPELVEFAQANQGKPWWQVGADFNTKAAEIAARKAGTPAGVVPPQGQVAKADLVAEFRKELAEGLKAGQHGMRFLRQLQQKYVEKGADIEDLDISPKDSVRTRDYLYMREGPR